MEKYRASFYGILPGIVVVEVDRETPACVFLPGKHGRKAAKISTYESYHDTIEQARSWLAEKIEDEMKALERRTDQLEAKVDRLAELHEKIATMEAKC